MFCGLPGALSVSTSVALAAPLEFTHAGVNVAFIVQLAFTAIVTFAPRHASELMAKSAAFAPVMLTAENCSAPVPLFVVVIVTGELVVCTAWFPKLTLAGKIEIPACVAVPLMATVCGLPDALSAMLTIAVREPVAVGENVALTWQLVPAPSDFPAQLSDTLKS